MGEKALDSKDKGYGMDAPGSSPNYDGYKNNYKALDSKDGEYEMRSILNGYKNKDQKEYFNDPYKREYRGPCCPGWELDGALCYPQCAGGFTGIGPVCWRGFDSYGQELEQSHGHLDNYRRKEKIN